jgi:uncharacterized protein
MLATVVAAIALFALLFAGMAIGVILSNKPVKGSCGGLGAAGVSAPCEICGGEPNRCDAQRERKQPRTQSPS